MNDIQEIHNLAKSGADSVFSYIQRTAESVSDGIRWQTLNYYNQPQYEVMAFNGVSGISLFLSDYYRLSGESKARDLALGANQWCSAPEKTVKGHSLCFGRAGVGMAWLRFSITTGDSNALKKASEIGDRVLESSVGPVTDYLGGVAGKGIFLLRLWEASPQEKYLSGAVRYGEWLSGEAIRDKAGLGCYWPMRFDESPPWNSLGFAHGIAGIGYFLLLLYKATQDSRRAELARGVAETLSKQAKPDRGGLNWPVTLGENDMDRCQWCHGAPGVGLFYTKAYEILGEPSYLKTAQAAGETTFTYGDVRHNPCQCHGLSGNAELFTELYRITQDRLWLDRAYDFASRAFSYRETKPEGDIWQSDEPGYYSPDFLCGAAGVGHFFLRLLAPDRVRMPLM